MKCFWLMRFSPQSSGFHLHLSYAELTFTLLLAWSSLLLQKIINQLIRRVAHLNGKNIDPVGKVVVHPDGRHRHNQAESSGDERFRNAASHDRHARAFHFTHLLKSIEDADDRAEQANK